MSAYYIMLAPDDAAAPQIVSASSWDALFSKEQRKAAIVSALNLQTLQVTVSPSSTIMARSLDVPNPQDAIQATPGGGGGNQAATDTHSPVARNQEGQAGNAASTGAAANGDDQQAAMTDLLTEGDRPVEADCQWFHAFPKVVWLVIRRDLDTIQKCAEHETLIGRSTAEEQTDVWLSCTHGHGKVRRSFFYHTFSRYEDAVKRAGDGAKKSSKFAGSTVVALHLWDLARRGILGRYDLIDMRTDESQHAYFANTLFADRCNLLNYQKINREVVIRYKGSFVSEMIRVDDKGARIGALMDLLNVEENGVYSWKDNNHANAPLEDNIWENTNWHGKANWQKGRTNWDPDSNKWGNASWQGARRDYDTDAKTDAFSNPSPSGAWSSNSW